MERCLLHLVNNIVDTGKVEIGELEVNPTPNAIGSLLEKVWGVCAQLIKTKRLNGRMYVKDNLPDMVSVDHHRLMQILLNLVGNAIKFTDTGSILIDVQWLSGEDEVTEESFEPCPFDEDGLFEKIKAVGILNKNFRCLDAGLLNFVTKKGPFSSARTRRFSSSGGEGG